jgi:hypothetical protein
MDYVANLSETYDPDNPFKLITKIQAGPDHTDDSLLLLAAFHNLVKWTGLATIITEGDYGGNAADLLLEKLPCADVANRDPRNAIGRTTSQYGRF